MDLSPYLYAIQSLAGQTPSEKKKELHSIANKIISNNEELLEFVNTNKTDHVQPALVPYLKILVGKKSMLNNVVIEALKSNDVRVVNLALKANWFFDRSNVLICANYFKINIFPFVSLNTRRKLIKNLASCLVNEPSRSKDFFEMLLSLGRIDQAMLFIVAFKERYIFDTILKYKLVLPPRILSSLYKKHPKVAIRYLQLGNHKKLGNKEDKKIHQITLSYYRHFLPKIVKHHTPEFIQLYDCLENPEIKLGRKRAKYFINNATIILITKPEIFLKLLPLKQVTKTLSAQHFRTMFENLFPKYVKDFDIDRIAGYLKYYPQDKKLDLLNAKYHLLYNDEVFRNEAIIKSPAFYNLFSKQLIQKYKRQRIKAYSEKNVGDVPPCKLPPKVCIPLVRREIAMAPYAETIMHGMEHMIISCSIYESKEDLLQVLEYFHSNFKNESCDVFFNVLDCLTDEFDLGTLSKSHWQIIKDLVLHIHERGDFYSSMPEDCEILFESALNYYVKQCLEGDMDEADEEFLEKLVHIVLESFLLHDKAISFLMSDSLEVISYCLRRFLLSVPRMYPEDHEVWTITKNKLNMAFYFIHLMCKFNYKRFPEHFRRKKKKKEASDGASNDDLSMFAITDYPWMMNIATNLMKINENLKSFGEIILFCSFKEMLQIHDKEFYQRIIDDNPTLINDVKTHDALTLLKQDPKKIRDKWALYLEACRKSIEQGCEFTKFFVASIKWHHDLPMNFVRQSKQDIKLEGSVQILKILLEKDEFDRVMKMEN